MKSLANNYQPTLLSASVSGLVILWLITFIGEIYGDLDTEKQTFLFRSVAWIFPVFIFNCLNLGIQYAFRHVLSDAGCILINTASSATTFVAFGLCGWEIRRVVRPFDDMTAFLGDIHAGLIALWSEWIVLLAIVVGLALRHRPSEKEHPNDRPV